MITVGDLKMYDLEEISKKTGISVKSLRKWIRQGKLKAKKLGVKYYVSEDDLIEFLKKGSDKETK